MSDENNKDLLTVGEFGKIVEEFKKAYANGVESCDHEKLLNKLLKIKEEEEMNEKKSGFFVNPEVVDSDFGFGPVNKEELKKGNITFEDDLREKLEDNLLKTEVRPKKKSNWEGLFTNPKVVDSDFGFGPVNKEKYKKVEGSFEDDLREKLEDNLKPNDKLISYGENVSKFVEMLVEYYRNLLKSDKKYVDLLRNENKLLAEKVNFLKNRAEEYENVIEMLIVDKNVFNKKKECCKNDFSLPEMYEKLFDNDCPTLENMRKEKQNKDKKGLYGLKNKKVAPNYCNEIYKKESKED